MRRRFWALLALVVVGAVGVRVAYVLTVTRYDLHLYDASYYELEARAIAQDGHFFKDPWAAFRSDPPTHLEPSADHAPLTTIVLLPAALITDPDDSRLAMRFTMVLLGLGAVVVIGLLGRAVGGDTVGLVAAGFAALDPNLWMNDGLVMSESLTVLSTATLLLLAYRVLRGASWRWVIALGAVCGVLVLVRAELALFTLLVAVPATWLGHSGASRERLARAVACASIGALVVLPWVGFNAARFDKPVLVSTNTGLALVGANCPAVYYGSRIGAAEIHCAILSAAGDPSIADSRNQSRAFDYIGDHIDRLPVVVLARIGRTWGVFNIGQTAGFDENEGRPVWASYLGIAALYALAALAVVGGVVLRRRAIPIWPLVMSFVVVTIPLVLVSGLPRYRAAAEPALLVLAAAGIVALCNRTAGRRDAAGRDQASAPMPGSGVLPGSRTSATAAHRSVAVKAPTNARCTTPSRSAITVVGIAANA